MSTRYPIPQAGLHRSECTIQRSLFIATTAHTPSTDAARAFIDDMRKRYADATHNCWAFVAGAPAQTAQVGFSDDGEPHGTAGRPMLTVLLHSGIGELTCVVTRYYGGVKLGTGGLVRAYQGAVRENIDTLPTQQRIIAASLTIHLGYSHVDNVRRILPAFEAQIHAEDYTAAVCLGITLPEEHRDAFSAQIVDITNGTARVELD